MSSRVSEASDMDDFPKGLCGWSWEENKLFELALAVVDEQHPDRWEVVAAMVGGEKSAGDVQEHYVILLEDLQVIESGKLDNKLGEAQPCVLVDCTESLCFSDNDTSITEGILKNKPDFSVHAYFRNVRDGGIQNATRLESHFPLLYFNMADVLYTIGPIIILQRTLVGRMLAPQTVVRMIKILTMNYPTQSDSELLIEVWQHLYSVLNRMHI